MAELPKAVDLGPLQALPKEEGRHKVRCWSPDPTKYIRGDHATIVPRAKVGATSGRNRGFDPGAYAVDVMESLDDESMRRVGRVDPEPITPELSKQVYDEVVNELEGASQEDIAIEVYSRLSQPRKKKRRQTDEEVEVRKPLPSKKAAKPRLVPTRPSREDVPRPVRPGYKPAAYQEEPEEAFEEPKIRPRPRPEMRPVKKSKTSTSSSSSELSRLARRQAKLDDQLELLLGMVSELQDARTAPPAPPKKKKLKKVATAAVEPTAKTKPPTQQNSAGNNPLAELQIPDLSPTPQMPAWEVEFDFGDAGTMTARYHWVIEDNSGLFLVYDRRFKLGNIYVPPMSMTRERPIRLRLANNNETYHCLSPKFSLSLGVFYVVCLIVVNRKTVASRLAAEAGRPPVMTDLNGVGKIPDSADPFQLGDAFPATDD